MDVKEHNDVCMFMFMKDGGFCGVVVTDGKLSYLLRTNEMVEPLEDKGIQKYLHGGGYMLVKESGYFEEIGAKQSIVKINGGNDDLSVLVSPFQKASTFIVSSGRKK